MPISILPQRGVVELAGADRVAFLQGLVSNDVTLVAPGLCVWAALLTPQGKWLADFFIFHRPDALLLDCEREQAPVLVERLGKFRLRSKIGLRDASAGFAVVAGWDDAVMPEGAAPDPRVAAAGWRGVMQRGDWPDFSGDYDLHRLTHGLPDGSRDLVSGQTVLLEARFDELHGISWDKGCYMGQELTARTKYRGLVKRWIAPVRSRGGLPPPGTPIHDAAGIEIGEMRSGRGEVALALLRRDAGSAPWRAGEAVVTLLENGRPGDHEV